MTGKRQNQNRKYTDTVIYKLMLRPKVLDMISYKLKLYKNLILKDIYTGQYI